MANNSNSIGGDFEGNLIQDSTVKGNVSAAINKIPPSPDADKPGIKERLEQLKTAIETEPSLDRETKIEALEEVQALAEVSQRSKPEERKKPAKRSIALLEKIFSGLQTGATLVETWKTLLPVLLKLFGIG